MNIDEYDKAGRARYQRLAEVIESIVQHGLSEFDGIGNHPQTQSRAKDAGSLKAKLTKLNLVASGAIESEIKDLAGCRIIFYTATDLERFRQSDFWRQNFEIDWAASKTHFPRDADASDDDLYQGIHYVVRLKESRTALVEYADLAGLRCEVQLQTILNHAWSETSHGILYKADRSDGFGARQHEEIKKRFARVMREHLMPAGYDLQKIQEDAERLQAGREVFDESPLTQLAQAKDNNERSDLLEKIRTHLLPGLDDVSAHIPDVRRAVVEAISAARNSATVPREGVLGAFRGESATDVLKRGLEILDDIRYGGEIEASLSALAELWEGATDPKDKESIEGSLGRLAEFSIPVWNRAGPHVQRILVANLKQATAERRAAIRQLVLVIARAALATEMSGSEATSYNAITFSRGTLPASNELIALRRDASELALEALLSSSGSDEWRSAWSALWSGVHRVSDPKRAVALRRVQLTLVRKCADFVREHHAEIPKDVLQGMEEDLHWEYRRLFGADSQMESVNRQRPRDAAIEFTRRALIGCRDEINADVGYVRYKTLVGFRTVFFEEWDQEFDFKKKDELRTERIAAYAGGVSRETFEAWLATVKECASTESNDLATFPPLTAFLKQLSALQPELALEMLGKGGEHIERFAPSLLPGLLKTSARPAALEMMQSWIAKGKRPSSIARSLFVTDEGLVELIRSIGAHVIAAKDEMGCFEIAHAALKHGNGENSLLNSVFAPAVDLLTSADRGELGSSHLFAGDLEARFEDLPQVAADAMLRNFVLCRQIGLGEQQLLIRISKKHEEAVWRLFEHRVAEGARRSWEDHYEAAPDHWYGLEKILGNDVKRTFDRVRQWPDSEQRGGRDKADFLGQLYATCDQSFVDGVVEIIQREGAAAVEFVCAVAQQFSGNAALYPVCKAAVVALPEDAPELSDVTMVLLATGYASGEMGMAEAYESKVTLLKPWQDDPDERLKIFAGRLIADLERMALEERQRGTERRERRKRDFGDGEG